IVPWSSFARTAARSRWGSSCCSFWGCSATSSQGGSGRGKRLYTRPQSMVDLSVVIPVHNEEDNLDELYREFTRELTAFGRPYELIVVDDGSTDESFSTLARLQKSDA